MRPIAHEILAPDDRTGLIRLGVDRKRRNETIQAYLDRSTVRGPVAPICVINGVPVLRHEWGVRRIRSRDRVRFCYRLGGTGNGRGVAVMSIVALLALTVLAPYAGAALASGAAAMGLGASLGGVAYTTIFSGISLQGGSIMLPRIGEVSPSRHYKEMSGRDKEMSARVRSVATPEAASPIPPVLPSAPAVSEQAALKTMHATTTRSLSEAPVQ